MSDNTNKRIGLIACGVLAIDLKRIAAKLGIDIYAVYLQGGLHNNPSLLREKLQAAIDEMSQVEGLDRIVIGYGLCGNGAVGIHSAGVPLVIPRVHDCIALFLGSDEKYKQQFAKYPGTYYISAGWYEEKVHPQDKNTGGAFINGKATSYEQMLKDYGQEKAKEVKDFLSSWQKNYQRAVFINTDAPWSKKYEEHAQNLAGAYGWKYERIEGDSELLEKSLLAKETTDDVLVVAPEQTTVYDAAKGKISAAAFGSEQTYEPFGRIVLEAEGQNEQSQAARLGLGIDAGGTYTDAAIYDFTSCKVLAKAKALTTKWDFSIGIRDALDQLGHERFGEIDLVSVSTTLATNAIVEGHGSKVGLLVMPPSGIFELSEIEHSPSAIIKGRVDIDGKVVEPIDADQVRKTVADMKEQGVKDFAVSGYAGAINPQLELEVKAVIKEATSSSVTCGHELSEMLNFKTRAVTAVLNARIIGRIEKFIREIKHTLKEYEINAPVVVVKGDGTLMSDKVAGEKPIETILSGPAASVAGAGFLTELKNTVVVDMGGTTTDIAAVNDGVVKIHEQGTSVGGRRTHVKALDMRTVGLGGDSGINIIGQDIAIGPVRVGPVCWMAAKYDRWQEAMDYIHEHSEDHYGDTRPMSILVLSGRHEHINLTKDESRIVKLLSERPYSIAELTRALELPWHTMLNIENLEQHHIVTRCSLTPTDILHITGEFQRWEKKASEKMCDMLAVLSGKSRAEFIRQVRELITRKIAVEILKKQIDEKTDAEEIDKCSVCRVILDNMFDSSDDNYQVSIELKCPVVGVGAPAVYFVPQAAKRLGTKAIIAENGDVANAIGAISSDVLLRKTVRINIDNDKYVAEGLTGARRFAKLEDAHNYAVDQLAALLREAGREAGTSSSRVEIFHKDIIAPAANGMQVYLGREITASLAGKPDVRMRR
jgi:N-methylhydantoinase A/oxoprolinase/acetone carboxylase beta subunit